MNAEMSDSDGSEDSEAPMLVEATVESTGNEMTDIANNIEQYPTVKPVLEETPKIDPIPITILTGWLGSGKTTLLRHLMTHPELKSRKIAVIQNEFSAVGVEEGLRLEDESGNLGEYLELPNGCVCCSVKTTFTLAVEELVRKQKFDFIIVECSGLADPGPLATMFWVDAEELESPIYLDGLISVVDAKHIESHLDDKQSHSQQVIRQLAFADVIVLNKLDCVVGHTEAEKEENIETIKKTLGLLNPAANLVPVTRSAVNINDVLSLRAFGATGVHESKSKEELEGKTLGHVHDLSISSIVLTSEKLLDKDKTISWLDKTLWAHADDGEVVTNEEMQSRQEIFRAKASFCFKGNTRLVYMQAVQETYEMNDGELLSETPTTSKMVIIGKNLNDNELQQGFHACVAL